MTSTHQSGERSASRPPHGNKVAIVTGTSSGFGLLSAVSLANCGYQVIATMRDLTKSNKLIEESKRVGVINNIHCLQLDVTNSQTIEAAIRSAFQTWGRIDVLVNNAGYAVGGYVEDIPMYDWEQQMNTNFLGLVAVTKAVLPIMRTQACGTIINVSSVSGKIGFPGYAPYAASKFAIEGFSEALRHEMLPFGVKVALIEPGSYQTDIWQKGFDTIHSPEHSAYRSKLEKMLKYSRQSAASAPHPQEVADLIVRIANHKNPKLRYPIGKGAALILLGKSIIPWKGFERIIARLLK
jgi:NADP-dependent 3-hydroxy acid dehydrogenase YdfG